MIQSRECKKTYYKRCCSNCGALVVFCSKKIAYDVYHKFTAECHFCHKHFYWKGAMAISKLEYEQILNEQQEEKKNRENGLSKIQGEYCRPNENIIVVGIKEDPEGNVVVIYNRLYLSTKYKHAIEAVDRDHDYWMFLEEFNRTFKKREEEPTIFGLILIALFCISVFAAVLYIILKY